MRTTTPRLPRRPLPAAVATALLTLSAGSVLADEPSPYYIGASLGVTHDSNVYRIANGRGDTYYTTSLLGGFDQSISRQHVYASANVGYNKYSSESTLNNTSYAVAAGWDWATINELSGNLNASANQSLATLYGNALQPSTERNLVRTDQVSGGVTWGGAGRLSVSGNYAHSRVHYSNAANDSSGDTASAGLNYRVGADITVGVASRFTRTRQEATQALGPTGVVTLPASTTNGRNLDLTASWRSTAQTNLSARLSWTRQTSDNGQQDFSGLTGSLNANYAPTGKLTFNASYSRDAGTNGTYFNSVNLQAGTVNTYLSQNSTTSDALGLTAAYAATAKVTATAGLQYRRARYDNSGLSDTFRVATLGANWAATRNASLGCNVSHESRSLTVNAYSANVVGCTATISLR